MREAVGLAERVAPTDANVLVTGESGSGKDALAAFIHSRSIALTNADLKNAVERRAFRDDLFYRLNVVQIVVPPLRERLKDFPSLARAFVQMYTEKHGRKTRKLSREAHDLLLAYEFPGNV